MRGSMKKTVLCVLASCLVFASAGISYAQQIRSMEFKDQEIKDILLVLGDLNGISIVPDETVAGKATYFFSNMEFEQALRIFLDSYSLTFTKENGVYYISKIKVSFDKAKNLVSLSANNVALQSIIKQLSAKVGKTILYDNLPNDPFSIVVDQVKIEEVLKICIAKYPDFSLDIQDSYYYLRKKSADGSSIKPGQSASKYIKAQADSFSFTIDKARFKELVIDLFYQAKKEFVLLMDRDVVIENLYVSGKDFDSALKTLLLISNADFSVSNGVYYIVEVQRKDLVKKFLTTLIIPLANISASELNRIIPNSLAGSAQMKIDEKSNKIVLSGTLEEIRPLVDFISLVDKPGINNTYYRFDLNFLKTDELFPIFPQEIMAFTPVALPGKTSFVVAIPESKKRVIDSFLEQIDRGPNTVPVRLKYIKAEDLFAQLPPSVTEAHVVKTKDVSLLFFKGTEAQRIKFMRDLLVIDVPKPQIRYEILVVQFDEGKGLSFDTNTTMQSTKSTDANAVVGNIGKLLGLNIDVISDFGYSFGMDLSASMSSNRAKILADTTLNGLSGEKVSFQNTNTFRYKDTEIDPTTGKPANGGIVRELSSGLIISFEGWVSGDNMITMKVDTTLSKKGEGSSTSGVPPATSEKKISTNIRTASGKPIVIGGLKQQDDSKTSESVPLLGDIPLLGIFFSKPTESVNKTEFAIYIIPHVEMPDESGLSLDDRMYASYQKFKKVL